MNAVRRIAIVGATGYVGRRLLQALLERGRTRPNEALRCIARHPQNLRSQAERGVEVVSGDVLERESLAPGLEGVDTAYYLVHSMGSDGAFVEEDRLGAENFAAMAKCAGVRRIIYLGALGRGDDLSPHLASRQEVGRILRESGPETIEFRASIVIGSGSLSFELVRALVERLPVMVTPKWVDVRAQPIAIQDLTDYLVAALDQPADGSRVLEIGGALAVSYGDLMREYAKQRGLKRRMIPVPLLSPRLSSLWLGLVTPVYARIGAKLVRSITHETVVVDEAANELFDIEPMGMPEAISAALRNEDEEIARSRWYDAVSSTGNVKTWAGVRFGNRLMDARSLDVDIAPTQAFAPIQRIGGETGWYAFDWLWDLRGWLDLLVGGVGVRRGRNHPEKLAVGEALDFWRVESFEPGRLLRLAAEMKMPGRAQLEFEVAPNGNGATIRQTAIYDPIGLAGLLYWYSVYPLHCLIFARMLRNIARAGRTEARLVATAPDATNTDA